MARPVLKVFTQIILPAAGMVVAVAADSAVSFL